MEKKKSLDTPKTQKQNLEKIQNVDFLNIISTEEFLKILNAVGYNLENFISYYNKDHENEKNLTKDDLKNKKVSEILQILNKDGDNETIENIVEILKSPKFNNIYLQLKDYNLKNIFLEAFIVYNTYFLTEDLDNLSIDSEFGKLTKRETLLDSNFKEFLKTLEKEFGEKIDEDISILINIYHGLDNSLNLFNKEKIAKIKDFLNNYPKNGHSFPEKLVYAINSIDLKDEKNDIEKLNLLNEIEKNFLKFGIKVNKDMDTSDFSTILLKDLKKELEKSEKYKGFFEKVGFSFELNFYDYFSLLGNNRNILDNSTIYRKVKFFGISNDDDHFTFGNNLKTLFEKIGNDTTDFLNDEKDKDLGFIEGEFQKFLNNFGIKNVDSIEKFVIIWDNFSKYLNLSEDQKAKFLENKNFFKEIPLVSGKEMFLADNLGNFTEYNGSPELKKFLENIQKNYKNIKIDYIPNHKEFSKSSEVLKIYQSLKNEWKLTKFNLSDLFLATQISEFILDKNNSKKFLELKKLYGIKINSLEKLLFLDIDFNYGNNANFDDNKIIFYITHTLSEERFNYLKNNKDIILSRINPGDKNISFYDLYNISDNFDGDIAFNKNEKRISDLEKKFQNLGFSKQEISKIFSFVENTVPHINGLSGKDLLYYYVKNYEKDKTLDKVLVLFVYVREKFLDKSKNQDNFSTLLNILDIYDKKSELYKKGPEEFRKDMKILEKYNLKERSFDSILMYLRNLDYNPNLKKYLNDKNFEEFNKKISEKYHFGENKIFTLVYNIEIYKYLESKPEFKKEIENGNFSKVEKVMDFLKNKFGVNNRNHPSILNYSFRFAENFEKTLKIYEKMESLGEKTSINDMMIFSIIAKEIASDSSKENFFFDKTKLIDYIEQNIYTREKYERPSVEVINELKNDISIDKKNGYNTSSKEEQLRKIQEAYTERPDLKTMTLKELQHIYVNSKVLENLDKKDLEKILDTDVSDHSTESGGYIYVEFDEKTKNYKTDFFLEPSLSLEDGSYNQITKKFMPGLHFHMHALGYENKASAGASGYGSMNGGDLPFTYFLDSINILFTPVYRNSKGKKVGVDLYWLSRDFDKNNPDYSKFKQVDLGTVNLNNFK